METDLWTFLGLFIGIPIGFVFATFIKLGKITELYNNLESQQNEIHDLRSVRNALKEEIHRLDEKVNGKKTYN